MTNTQYHSSSHCKYLIQYHIIWCPKFRFQVLNGDREYVLRHILIKICNDYGFTIKAVEIMPDHIHIFIDCPHTFAPCEIVRMLKSKSAVEMFKACPELKTYYSKTGKLWGRGYFISTVGCISEETVKRYINNQKKK